MISTVAPSGSGVVRSASTPLMVTATAALARREPMAAARSAPVDPAGRERDEPSGRWIVIESAIAAEASGDLRVCPDVLCVAACTSAGQHAQNRKRASG